MKLNHLKYLLIFLSLNCWGQKANVYCDCDSVYTNKAFTGFCAEYYDSLLKIAPKKKGKFKSYVHYTNGKKNELYPYGFDISSGDKILFNQNEISNSDSIVKLSGLYELQDKKGRIFDLLFFENGFLKKDVNKDFGIFDLKKNKGKTSHEIAEFYYSKEAIGRHYIRFRKNGAVKLNEYDTILNGRIQSFDTKELMGENPSELSGIPRNSTTDNIVLNSYGQKSKLQTYWKFLQKDSTQNNTLFTGSYGFMYSQQGKVNQAGQGFSGSLGINLARLFNKKMVLGVVAELKGFKGLWSNNYTSQFINDFNSAYKNGLTNQADSSRASILNQSLNGNTTYRHWGNYFQSIGIMFSPYPQQYGGLMLIVKKGSYGFPINGSFSNKFINPNNNGPDFISVDVPVNFSIELACKPMAFFRNTSQFVKQKWKWLDFVRISIYYQRLSWKNADMDGLPFNTFLNSDFLSKYAIDEQFGFRICGAFY